MNVFEAHYELTLEQEKLMKLARLDAEQLLSRAESLPNSRYRSLFATSLENAVMWFNKAVTHPTPFDPEEEEDGD